MDHHPKALPQPGIGLSAALASLIFAFTPLAIAAGAPAEGPGITLLAGEGDSDYERVGLSLHGGPMWSTDWGNWKASLRPELEVSRFRYTGPAAGPDSLNQIGALGRLHLHYGAGRFRPYAEAGFGGALFSRDTLGRRDFATRFQFSEHFALGVEWAGRFFVGLQFSHYSNAGIEKPNDGINMNQIVVGMHF